MIIEYDKSPEISNERRLRSLMESVQRALDELEQKNVELKAEIDSLKKELSNRG